MIVNLCSNAFRDFESFTNDESFVLQLPWQISSGILSVEFNIKQNSHVFAWGFGRHCSLMNKNCSLESKSYVGENYLIDPIS